MVATADVIVVLCVRSVQTNGGDSGVGTEPIRQIAANTHDEYYLKLHSVNVLSFGIKDLGGRPICFDWQHGRNDMKGARVWSTLRIAGDEAEDPRFWIGIRFSPR